MTRRNDPRTIAGWAMYDWANSAYVTTTATALLPPYFAASVLPAGGLVVLGRHYDGQTLWAYTVGATALLVLLLAPVLGAIADFSAAKKRFLRVFAYGGGLAAVALGLVGPGDVLLALVLFTIAQTGLVGGNVFYDAFLPELTTPDTIDRVSARGYAYGYVGGGIQFALALVVVVGHEALGLATGTAVRLALASAGLWWLAFAAFALARLPEIGTPRPLPPGDRGLPAALAYARVGVRQTWVVVRALGAFTHLARFLAAYVVYMNGVLSVIALASVYATDTLRLDAAVILITLLVVQLVAFFGAHLFAALAARMGTKPALLVSLGLWILVAVGACFLPPGAAVPFALLGGAVGLVQGGTQALSRSLFGSMIPEGATAQFFGVFSVFSKAAAVLGPLAFAMVTDATGSSRAGILSLVVFFVGGALLLARVDVEAARSATRDFVSGRAPSSGGRDPG